MDGMQRPKMTVLPDSALVPDQNVVAAPTEFTHEVIAERPFYFAPPGESTPPNGTFPPGTKLLLISHEVGARFCQVVDSHGLCVLTPYDGVRSLGKNVGS